jgi:hypothetical protein
VELIVIVFLVFQFNDNAKACRDAYADDQKLIKNVSRLLIQAHTQQHPLYAHESIVQAHMLLNDLVNRHGGVVLAEKHLELAGGKLSLLQTSVEQQLVFIQSHMMENFILKQMPELDSFLNDSAGISNRSTG